MIRDARDMAEWGYLAAVSVEGAGYLGRLCEAIQSVGRCL
jgi:hypothetical protein